MSEEKFVANLFEKKKTNLIKPIIIGISIFCFSLLIYLCFNLNNKSKIKSPIILNETPNKITINPYVSPYRVEGILDNLFFPYHSDIIKTVDEFEFLRDTLGKVELRMILNSNIHGAYAADFHEKANYHHLLILVETLEGNRFGGYTSDNFIPLSVGLTSTSVDVQKYDEAAFLFNLDLKKIYEINRDKVETALNCDEYYTLSFGEKDLVIWDYFLTKGGVSNFPDYYGEGSKSLELTGESKISKLILLKYFRCCFIQNLEMKKIEWDKIRLFFLNKLCLYYLKLKIYKK